MPSITLKFPTEDSKEVFEKWLKFTAEGYYNSSAEGTHPNYFKSEKDEITFSRENIKPPEVKSLSGKIGKYLREGVWE